MARIITYTQEVTTVANHESEVITMEDATNVSVQFNCPSIPIDADFDLSLMVSNDGVYWHYSSFASITGNALVTANFPDDSKYFESDCRARFIKILIENHTDVTAPTIVTATICIVD